MRNAGLRLFALLVVALTLCPTAQAQEAANVLLDRTGFDRLERLSSELGGPDVREIAEAAISGKLDLDSGLPGRMARQCAADLRRALLDVLSALAAPVLATLLLRMALGRRDGALALLCRLACACALTQRFASAMTVAREAMTVAARAADAASPVLAATLTLTGAGGTAAMLSPATALCVAAIEKTLIACGLPLCGLAAVVAAGGNLSGHFRLDGLFALIRRVVVVGVRLLVGGFVGLMALEGRLASAQDSAAASALGQTLRGLIPFIGGSVSDTSGALLECALTVRNAVGVTGMMIVIGACTKPVLALAAHALSLKLASAVVEPVADPGIARITSAFGDIARMLLALCVGGMLLAAILAGCCLGVVGAG